MTREIVTERLFGHVAARVRLTAPDGRWKQAAALGRTREEAIARAEMLLNETWVTWRE